MKNIIYYFSGTGNSLAVARAIAARIGECELVDIAKEKEPISVDATERVGFVFPLYFWGLPAIAHEFVSQIRISGTPYVFCVITAGGNSTGIGIKQTSAILSRNGTTLSAGFKITMPDNYFVFYDSEAELKNSLSLEESKPVIENVADKIERKASAFESPRHWHERILGHPVNALFRRNVHGAARHFRVSTDCTGCGKCERTCGVGTISMVDKKPSWGASCEQCFGCINACPAKAISYRTSKKIIAQYTYRD